MLALAAAPEARGCPCCCGTSSAELSDSCSRCFWLFWGAPCCPSGTRALEDAVADKLDVDLDAAGITTGGFRSGVSFIFRAASTSSVADTPVG